MKKYILIIVIPLIMPFYAICQEDLKDVPADHFAHDAIYDLIDRGVNVSQGYPDGTFSGNKTVTRYENAYFMAALALDLSSTISSEGDMSDLRDEISWLRREFNDIKSQPTNEADTIYFGSVQFKEKYGTLLAYDPKFRVPSGSESDYRLKFTLQKNLGKDASIRLNLDTMTATPNNFSTKIFDLETRLKLYAGLENPLEVKAVIGPGKILFNDISGYAPSENNTYFYRPDPSLSVSTKLGEYDIAGIYIVRKILNDGFIATSEMALRVGKKVGELPLFGSSEVVSTTRYEFIGYNDPAQPNNVHQEMSLLAAPTENISEKILLGISRSYSTNDNFYFNYELNTKDPNNGEDIVFKLNSVGAGYRLPFEALLMLPLNPFNRKILNGTVDVALEITQLVSKTFILKSTSDWVGNNEMKIGKDIPGTSFTQEFSFDYYLYKDIVFNMYYRYYQVPSRLDQFASAVPEVSDLIGLGLTCVF